jgi:hypothetical protein
LRAPDTGEAVFQDTAVQVSINHLANVGTERTILPLETILIDLIEGLEMVLYAAINTYHYPIVEGM